MYLDNLMTETLLKQNPTKHSAVNRCGTVTPALRLRDFAAQHVVTSLLSHKRKCRAFQQQQNSYKWFEIWAQTFKLYAAIELVSFIYALKDELNDVINEFHLPMTGFQPSVRMSTSSCNKRWGQADNGYFTCRTLSQTIQQLLYLVIRRLSTSAEGKVQAEEQMTVDLKYRPFSYVTQKFNELRWTYPLNFPSSPHVLLAVISDQLWPHHRCHFLLSGQLKACRSSTSSPCSIRNQSLFTA